MSKVIFVYKKFCKKSPTLEYIDSYTDEYLKTHYTDEYKKNYNFRLSFPNNNYRSAEECLLFFIFECKDVSYGTRKLSMNYDVFVFVDSDLHDNYEETLLVYKKVAKAFSIDEFESFKIEEITENKTEEITENKPYKPRNFPWDTRGWQPK